MALPQFCIDCQNLLNDIDPGTRIAVCSSCTKPHPINPDDRTVLIVTTGNSTGRQLTDREIYSLHGLPTTSRITKVCPACKYDVASMIHDAEYNFSFRCLKCEELF